MNPISIEEIITQYPLLKPYENQPDTIRQLYEQMHPNVKKDLTEAIVGDKIEAADILVIKTMGESSWIGCPVCFTKLGEHEGITVECNSKCRGEQRLATRLHKYRLLGGDTKTKVILDFLPWGFMITKPEQYVAKVISIKGTVDEIKETKVGGEVKSKTPVITVRGLTIVTDIMGKPTLDVQEFTVVTMPGASVGVPQLDHLPSGRIKAFKTWMIVMAKDKPLALETIKHHVESNLKMTIEDVMPLLKKEGDGFTLAASPSP